MLLYYLTYFKFCLLNSVLILIDARKYDVEVEALKLYGDDIHSVLQRFRKSPEYVKILNDKLKELNEQLEFVAIQIIMHDQGELKNKISKALGIVQHEHLDITTTPITSPNMYRAGNRQTNRRTDETTPKNLTQLEKFDKHRLTESYLTLAERNSYRDLGFECIGQSIHAIIKHMISEDEPAKSTRQPYEEDHKSHKKTTTTTPHDHVHEVTSSSSAGSAKSTSAARTTIMDSYKY